ncbi:MAG: DUF1002 domain-containing protein [Lachnospiraceae bacterium]|nr:DUF1002 domain-containing protein [Lachnospiraceae bacterium]
MRRHRWRRRFGVLVLLVLLGMTVLTVLGSENGSAVQNGSDGEETIVSWMIDKVTTGDVVLSDENSIRQAIAEGEKEFDISLTEENKEKIVGFMQTLDSIEVGAADFMEQAKQMYQKYSVKLVEEANTAINEAVEGAVESTLKSFFYNIRQGVADFFKNLLPS